MNRRNFLRNTIPLSAALIGFPAILPATGKSGAIPFHRVRPGDSLWPSAAAWEKLKQQVGGRLIKVESPLAACKFAAGKESCDETFRQLKNPYYIGDQPALTQTSGYLGAWTAAPSVYAIAAANAEDVVAGVNFARKNNLRLVVKGGGHSYQGTSNSADSLLIWTRAMNNITLHDDFVAQGCVGKQPAQHAVSVGSGAIWMHVYDVVTTKGGRYVQGGGCGTVGVAGLIQSGGFGSFSKNYGLAAAGLIEAEVVTADGKIKIANACTNPDLFWAIKGGGGGSFGVVTRLTLRTRELPELFGEAFGSIKAKSDIAYRNLIEQVVIFYNEKLFNSHWGEQIRFFGDNTINIRMILQGLSQQQVDDIWQPFIDWVNSYPNDYEWLQPLRKITIPAKHLWDADFLKKYAPQVIGSDDRPNASPRNIFWKGDQEEAGQFLWAYRSAWLSANLLKEDRRQQLADSLFATSRLWTVSLHFNKGLAGAPAEELKAAKDTAMNPAVLDAFALAIIAGGDQPAMPGLPGHEPDITRARRNADNINGAMNELLKVSSQTGSYVSESDFFEKDWQHSFWGKNYERLSAIKKKVDPGGLFFVHHGVGSEAWSDDGFTKKQS